METLDPLSSAEWQSLAELMRELRKIERGDLFVPVAHLQLHYLLNAINEGTVPEERRVETVKFARGVAFNVASFTWPGWDEPYEITEEMQTLGMSAAKIGLTLAEEIDDVTFNILWINGVHHLARSEHDNALSLLSRAASKVSTPVMSAMVRSWLALTKHFKIDSTESKVELDSAIAKLRGTSDDDSDFYADQLETAYRVLRTSQVD